MKKYFSLLLIFYQCTRYQIKIQFSNITLNNTVFGGSNKGKYKFSCCKKKQCIHTKLIGYVNVRC